MSLKYEPASEPLHMSAKYLFVAVLTDTVAVATRLHRHGALAFFDFATAGPPSSSLLSLQVLEGPCALS